MEKIGFIGLGKMGLPMARNLAKAFPKSQFFVNDLNKRNVDDFLATSSQSSVYAESPALIGEKCDVIVTMLPESSHVKNVYLNPNSGIKKGLTKNSKSAILIDSSTISPNVPKEIGNSLKELNKSVSFVDAPVSGGMGGAIAGTLTFMVGGSLESFKSSKPLLSSMGKNIVHCGELGTGQIAKICNNMMLAISMIGTSECLNLGKRLGIDTSKLLEILNTSSGQSWVTSKYPPVASTSIPSPASNNYAPGFASSLMYKDMGLAMNCASESGSLVFLASASREIYKSVLASNLDGKPAGDLDFSVVYKWIQENNGPIPKV
jgi:3-hydroxyisobutyrate dehydrogenase